MQARLQALRSLPCPLHAGSCDAIKGSAWPPPCAANDLEPAFPRRALFVAGLSRCLSSPSPVKRKFYFNNFFIFPVDETRILFIHCIEQGESAMRYVIIYFLIGILIVSIGSNIERGCNQVASTFAECIGFVAIWPVFAGIFVGQQKDFPCRGMNL